MRVLAGLVAAGLCLCAQAAHAVQCTVGATALTFGNYNAVSGPAALSTGTITVSCSNGPNASYVIALNPGGSGTYFPRQMSSGANHLSYQLFMDAARTFVWGDGSGGTSVISDRMSIRPPRSHPTTRNYTVYGEIPARQPISPGNYADIVTVTVTY